VLEGLVKYTAVDRTVLAGPGTTVHLPRGVPHSFEVQERSKVLLTLAPAGIKRCFGNWTD
jgi:quercetin dioxygenase-like cupin family protein